MENCKIIAIGDNVCDKYLSRGKMYPGGQCVNTCAFAGMNGISSAYMGKFGNDSVAECVKKTLDELKVDYTHSRTYKGENGYAIVTLNGNDRVFLGSNKGGIAKEYPFSFSQSDLDYIKEFQLIYTNLNSYIEDEIGILSETGIPIAYDFSVRWTDDYLKKIGPYTTVAIMSCAHLTEREREREMKKAHEAGIEIVLGTVGEDGSYVLYEDDFLFVPAVHADNVIDTMGAGDSYFAAFLCSLLKSSKEGRIIEGDKESMKARLTAAMNNGAAFASKVCAMEGAFGYGVPITGKTDV